MSHQNFQTVFSHAVRAYGHNIKLISLFSVPFLVAFPLALLLPNYTAFSGIFLRPDTIGSQATLVELALMLAVVLVSILLYSFSLASVNAVVRAQRTMVTLRNLDFQRVEETTFRIFGVLLLVFFLIFAFSLLMVQFGLFNGQASMALRALFGLIVAMAAIFAPQAIVIDHASVENAIVLSVKMISNKTAYTVGFLAAACVLVALNTQVFIWLGQYAGLAPLLGLAVNALVISPFLEVLKVQIYLSKYTLL